MAHGDIVQDTRGWFLRDNGNGTSDDLSSPAAGQALAQRAAMPTVRNDSVNVFAVLVRGGQPTTEGDRFARRVALMLAKRYATTPARG